jgi:hypothetical protein
MSEFYIINESTEDTLASAESLEQAIRMAQEAATQIQPGSLVSILESGGSAVKQFLIIADGTLAEQALVRPIKESPPVLGKSISGIAEAYRTEPNATPDRPHELR